MHKLAIATGLAAALLVGGLGAWRAEAMVAAGAAQVSAAAKAARPVSPIACRGGGPHCPPGYVWNGSACVPC